MAANDEGISRLLKAVGLLITSFASIHPCLVVATPNVIHPRCSVMRASLETTSLDALLLGFATMEVGQVQSFGIGIELPDLSVGQTRILNLIQVHAIGFPLSKGAACCRSRGNQQALDFY